MPVIADPGQPYGKFDFDLARAVLEQLVEGFETLPVGQLDEVGLKGVASVKGVYHLYLGGTMVYVGKADNLKKRLSEHQWNLAARKNLDLSTLGFNCLAIDRAWVPLTHEQQLIEHYGERCSWNNSGFGNHDPGRNREKTNKAPDGFDQRYPIQERWPLRGIEAGIWNARELLLAIKSALPYLFRFQVDSSQAYKRGSVRYNDLTIELPETGMAAEDLLREVARQFPPGWQATRFPSHFILYEEATDYEYGVRIYP